ncbi:MAG TPA: hypothetical protein VF591_21610 [Pyrinomonadaceae bacterium]
MLCLCVLPQQARAQYVYGTSAIGYDDNTKEVFGYSSTELDYYAGYYYDPYVEGFMYDQYNYNPISSGYNRGFAYYWPAEVGTYHWPALADTEYDVFSDHYVIAAWSTSVQVCDDYYFSGCWADYWYDAWGYGFLGGGDYGAPWWWWGNWYGGYVPERTYYLGTTGVYIITPEPEPSCNVSMRLRSVTPHRPEAGDLSGQTRTAMLGAEVHLTADVTVNGNPVSGESGTGSWSWSADDGFRKFQSQVNPSKYFIVWNTEGNHNVSVTYTSPEGCKITKSMTVNVTVPTVTQYTADLVPERLTTTNANCSEIPGRDLFTLGCAHPDTATTEPGITFRARAKIPDDSISDPTQSKIKFVQIVNLYRRQVTASAGTQCMTFRTSTGDDSPSAWRVDTQDPYQSESEPTRSGVPSKGTNRFGEDLISDIETRDSPGHSLSFPEQIFQLDIDERFEMLVEYFAGSSNPQQSTPGTTQIIGTLAWDWGGHATYLPSGDSYNYSIANPAGRHYIGVGTRQVRGFVNVPYNPRTDPNALHACPDGGPTPTPTPTPTPFPTPTPPGGCSGDNAEFVSQSVPTTMDAGVNYNVSVTMKNPCGSTWTSDVYKLGSQNPQDNFTWGFNRVLLPSGTNVGPGNTFTFNYTVTAPPSPGFYNFQWRMVREGVHWFGDFTPNVVVNVVGSGCDAFAEQDCYYNGGDWFDPGSCTCHYPPPCYKCDWQPVY